MGEFRPHGDSAPHALKDDERVQGPLELQVLSSLNDIEPWAPAWTNLLERSVEDSLFLTPEWHLSWLEAMHPEVAPRVYLLREPSGKVRAILPLALRHVRRGPLSLRLVEFTGEEMASGDHLGLIHDRGLPAAAWEVLAQGLRQLSKTTDCCRFRSMDVGETSRWLNTLTGPSRWRSLQSNLDVAPRLTLPRSFEGFMNSLSRKHRKEVHRLWRRFTAHDTVRVYLNEERWPLQRVLDDLANLHTRLWQQRGRTGTLADPRKQRFLASLGRRALSRQWLRLRQIIVGDTPCAIILVFHYKNTAYYYQSGWDPRYRSYKIGQAAVIQAIRGAIDEGLTSFDFLRGDEEYKSRFAPDRVLLTGLETAHSIRGLAYLTGKRSRSRVKKTWRWLIER